MKECFQHKVIKYFQIFQFILGKSKYFHKENCLLRNNIN